MYINLFNMLTLQFERFLCNYIFAVVDSLYSLVKGCVCYIIIIINVTLLKKHIFQENVFRTLVRNTIITL